MPTYAQLEVESWWRAEFVPPNMQTLLLVPLRRWYNMGPAQIGAKGDNNHLRGRHRSRNWCLNSIYCTNRSYGTTDARDKRGNGNWLRANDIGITGQTLFDACRRLDKAVRAGRLPGLAEWFGTFDGRTVVGWSNGHSATSDTSHLTHLHLGWWNEAADDAAQMQLAYEIVTGDDMALTDPIPATKGDLEQDRNLGTVLADLFAGEQLDSSGFAPGTLTHRQAQLKRIEDTVAELKARPPVQVDAAAVAKALMADPEFPEMIYQQALKAAQQAEQE